MPGDSHAFTFTRSTELQSIDNIRHSGECKSIATTPGNHLKLNTTSTMSKESKSNEKPVRVQAQPVELQSPTTTLVERKTKSSVTCAGKTSKTRLPSASCSQQHGPRTDKNSTVPKRKSLEVCTSCSSNEVIEVNIKLKSCQNCQNVVIDELNYDNQLADGQDDSSGKRTISNSSILSTSGSSSLNFYHQQLIGITKKLKNMYKNRIHSSCTDEQQQHTELHCTPSTSSAITPTTIETVASTHGAETTTTKTCSSADKKPLRIVAPQNLSTNFTNSIHNNHCYRNNLPTDDHECSASKTSSISTLPFKTNSSSNSNVINKDALILRICDLDDKLKSIQNESNMSRTRTPSMNDHNGEVATLTTAKASKSIVDGGKKSSPLLAQMTQVSNRKIIVISDEYKNKSEQHEYIIRDRKQLMKMFQQNKSKSLDLLPPPKHSNKTNLHRNMQNHIFSSQSVTNLPIKLESNKKGANNQHAGDDDDDDGPYESINSVELIFISDEFLNKAVKHDLKILKNKRTTTGNDSLRPTPTSSTSSSFKKKVRTLDSTTSPIRMLRPDSYSSDNQQSPSPVSPDSHQSSSYRSASHRASLTSSKKLIVISEDFKRKSLENNIVIVDTTCTSDSNSTGEVIDKRKKFQQGKRISRQQSSIDDVANQMISHAFRSFEEPDEQCLESKEIKTPE